MSLDKIPVTSEKVVTFEGLFELKETYIFLKKYLEDIKHYDVSEKDYAEKNDGAKKKIVGQIHADVEFTDYYKILLKFWVELSGKDEIIELEDGSKKTLTRGTARLMINSYIEPDYQKKKKVGPLTTFLNKVYDHYVGVSDLDKCTAHTVKDISDIVNKFKHLINTTIK